MKKAYSKKKTTMQSSMDFHFRIFFFYQALIHVSIERQNVDNSNIFLREK